MGWSQKTRTTQKQSPIQFSLVGRLISRIRLTSVFLLLIGMVIIWFFASYYLRHQEEERFLSYLEVLNQSLSQPLEYFDLADIDATLQSYSEFLDFDKIEVLDRYDFIQADFGQRTIDRKPDYQSLVISSSGHVVGAVRAWQKAPTGRPLGISVFLVAGSAQMLIIVILGSIIMYHILRVELIEPLSELTSAIQQDSIEGQFIPSSNVMRRTELHNVANAYQTVLSHAKALLKERVALLKNISNENDVRALQLHLLEEALQQSKMALTYRSVEDDQDNHFFGVRVRNKVQEFISSIHPELKTLEEISLAHNVDVHNLVDDPNDNSKGFEAQFQNGEIWRIRILKLDSNKIAIFASDETSRRHVENALNQKNKLESLGGVASGVAHDFNNILAIISSALEQLYDEANHSSDVLQIADDAVQRGAAIVKQLLQFVHVGKTSSETCNLSELLEAQSKTLSHLLGPSITLRFDVPRNINVVAEANYLQTVLVNLTINARDAIAKNNGLITFTVRPATSPEIVNNILDLKHEYVAIDIIDNGEGIPPELISRVFDPFLSTKPVGQGTGLGLSMAYEFLRRMGGAIYVSRSSPKGTMITVILRQSHAQDATTDATPNKLVAKPLVGSILIVDDEKPLAQFICLFLRKNGMNAQTANSVEEAIHALKNDSFGVVLSDMYMPDGTGIDIYNFLNSQSDETKFILMSGNFQLTAQSKDCPHLDVGVDFPFIEKPFKLDELKALLFGTS